MTMRDERAAPTLRRAQAYSGIRGARYRFMEDAMPETCRRMREDGTIESYLNDFERRFQELQGRLTDPANPHGTAAGLGLTEELKATDPAEWDRRASQAWSAATEMATRDLLESTEL